ncbi:MAG: glycoside hydrolase family 57 protein, partial [Thermodesulfovibrionales bacterium]|nr:glycoside hydrolase family 57 protein [Thermodesulfovibrionales bacterium]
HDQGLRELEKKGSNYSEDDKRYIISKHFEILKNIIPKYREVAGRGQIELSASPFYHPILPLLCDTDAAKKALPHIRLPSRRFQAPEDAKEQVKRAIEYFQSIFGFSPKGLWPSEGSVSEQVIGICREQGIKWMASDEDVLAASLGVSIRDSDGKIKEPALLYRPHLFEGMNLFFRDHRLSDLIGFVYSGWRPDDASRDFLSRLKEIHNRLDNKPYVVSIIMDGENAWEYYENDGRAFLNSLYSLLSSEDWIKTITVNEYLNEFEGLWKGSSLQRVHPGSWIHANFSVWIGHEEDNLAWDYLKLTRDELVRFEKEHPDIDTSPAWKLIYIAEGSDWNWWYGDEHVSETQEEFDELFRNNLIAVYKFIGKEPPAYLLVPILREDRAAQPTVTIRGFITPRLDGFVSSYFEWLQAAEFDVSRTGGSMHKAETIFEKIYYGFDRDNLYVRIDGKKKSLEILQDAKLVITFLQPQNFRIDISARGVFLKELRDSSWLELKALEAGIDDIVEIAVAFSDLGVKENDEIGFIINYEKNSDVIERIPLRGHVRLTVPGPYFEAIMWQ